MSDHKSEELAITVAVNHSTSIDDINENAGEPSSTTINISNVGSKESNVESEELELIVVEDVNENAGNASKTTLNINNNIDTKETNNDLISVAVEAREEPEELEITVAVNHSTSIDDINENAGEPSSTTISISNFGSKESGVKSEELELIVIQDVNEIAGNASKTAIDISNNIDRKEANNNFLSVAGKEREETEEEEKEAPANSNLDLKEEEKKAPANSNLDFGEKFIRLMGINLKEFEEHMRQLGINEEFEVFEGFEEFVLQRQLRTNEEKEKAYELPSAEELRVVLKPHGFGSYTTDKIIVKYKEIISNFRDDNHINSMTVCMSL